MREDIHRLLQDGNGIIRRRDHPIALAQRLDRLRSSGDLVGVLPGVLALPGTTTQWIVRLAAALAWLGPDAIVMRRSAARLTFWPECEAATIELSVPRTPPRARSGWSVTKGRVPPELTWRRNGVTVSCPAYTAVDLATQKDAGEVIDRVLRTRQATLEQLWEALAAMPARAGNKARADVLRDSRDKPWSELERIGHRLLRHHRITGWRTNIWVDVASGGGYYVDVLFGSAKLVIEFDGWEFHSDRQAFEDDRRRRNELVLAGYRVLNFTWRQLTDDPDWVIECIRRALRG